MNATQSIIQRMRLPARIPSKCINRTNYKYNVLNVILNNNCSLFSSISKGQDLLADSLTHGPKRKIILDSFYPGLGFDVIGMIEYTRFNNNQGNITTAKGGSNSSSTTYPYNQNDEYDNYDSHIPIPGMRTRRQKDHQEIIMNQNDSHGVNETPPPQQTLLMNSSIIAFPHSCFLWNNISHSKHVTIESLSIVQLIQPSIEFLFIGCDDPIPPRELDKIKKIMKERSNIVVDQMDVMNAMGTFNILNGEDRRVAVALVCGENSASSL